MSILDQSLPPNELFDVGGIYREFLDNFAKGLKDTITRKFQRSNELQAYVGQGADAEVMKILLRSIKVRFTKTVPARLEVEFKDELSHWYGGDLPKEFMDVINKMISEALEEEMVSV